MTQLAHRTPSLLQALETRLGSLLHLHGGGSGLLSLTLETPELAFDHLPDGLYDCSYWARPAMGRFLLGLGVAASVEAQGEGRFRALDAAFAEYRRLWHAVDADGVGFQPAALTGFAFGQEGAGDVPNSRLTIPTLLVQRREEVCAMTFTCDRGGAPDAVLAGWLALAGEVVAALGREAPLPVSVSLQRLSSQPDDDVWLARVARAVTDIRAGEIDKVVLARSIRVRSTQPFVPAALMATLETRYPGCIHFTHFFSGGGVLLGATPESLVALSAGQVVSDALAGTDWQSGRLDDEKSLHEHRLVVNAIVRALEPVCGFLQIPARPKVFELQELRHLRSVIRGTANSGVSLLNLVERLHPTPAIGGAPPRCALDWLARNGEERRGWYSGATGWIGYDGDGELAVALRCAWLDGNEAELCAGAGIVAGSDPLTELEETEVKLNAMLRVLGGQA
ncbi:MAG: isochorismate synthase [Gammaproteobacteria bacterium]|nr:isochorismate synthase [Gammaproteobacteria bacterium]MBU1977781.1 isochorismate synthase [Gammaproteobacteria bacterium]